MYTGELFEVEGVEALIEAGIAVDPAAIRPAWDAAIDLVLREAMLARPADRWMQSGGRRGRHSEYLGRLLAEMQVLHRAQAGAVW
jgi:ring-1,2-phenylacetyl-CoA epoxidase subunit PaaC